MNYKKTVDNANQFVVLSFGSDLTCTYSLFLKNFPNKGCRFLKISKPLWKGIPKKNSKTGKREEKMKKNYQYVHIYQ